MRVLDGSRVTMAGQVLVASFKTRAAPTATSRAASMKAHWQFRLAFCVAAGLLGPSPSAWANYPERPVRIVVGFGAGSAADLAARIVGEELGRTLGQHFIVENRPGAGSNTAAVSVAKGDADGYTLLLGTVANTINTSARVSSVNLMKDLKPIALICSLPNILVVHPSVKATTVQELIAVAKAEPGKLNYGSAGAGTSLHLSA